jgi:cell division inhibitor SulA
MPEFVIEREVPGASRMSEEEVRAASLKSLEALRQLGPDIRWLRSFVTDDKIFCIYYAPDEALIREHGKLAGIPVDRVMAVRRILEPEMFVE